MAVHSGVEIAGRGLGMRTENIALPSNRSFGALFAVVFAVLAVWRGVTSGFVPWTVFWAICSALVLAATVFAPNALTPFNRAWMRLALFLNRIVSPVVLGVMYAVLIVPVGLGMRLMGRDALHLKKDQNAASYWRERAHGSVPPESFKNQF